MRVCEKHCDRAVETLKSLKDGTEYDLCLICVEELQDILHESPIKEVKRGRKRVTKTSDVD